MACVDTLAHLFGTIFEGILWGVYFLLFLAALFLFRQRKGKGRQNRKHQIISATMLWMFCFATAHFAVSLRSLQESFFYHPTHPTSYNAMNDPLCSNSSSPLYNAEIFYGATSRSLYVADKTLDGVSSLIGNGLIIYRVYDIIPQHRRLIVFLVLLLLGSAGVDFYIAYRLSQNSYNIFYAPIRRVASAVFVMALALNISTAFLIILRIRQVERLALTRDGMHKLTPLRRMIITAIESGFITPAFLLAVLALYYSSSQMLELVLGPIVQVIGITPTIMWIQARLGLTRYDAAIEHYAFTVSRDMQFATPDRYPTRPSHRPLECLFNSANLEEGRRKEGLSPVGSMESFTTTTPKPPQCIPRGRPWQSPSVEQFRGPERREHPSSLQ